MIRGLRYKSQALMGVNKIFVETGVPDETQIDGEGALACPEAQEWLDGMKTHCVKIEAGQHFRHGKIKVRHRIWKGISRAMLDRAGIHIGWWYFAIRHAVLLTSTFWGPSGVLLFCYWARSRGGRQDSDGILGTAAYQAFTSGARVIALRECFNIYLLTVKQYLPRRMVYTWCRMLTLSQ